MNNEHLYEFQAMGTDCRLTLYAPDNHQAQQVADALMAEVWRIEDKYSRYVDNNVMWQINQAASTGQRISVDTETAKLLDFAFQAFNFSTGLFDISSGVLRKAWDFTTNSLPTPTLLASLLPNIGMEKIIWHAPELNFTQAGMELDLGGLAKEYAVDRCADICVAQGIQSGLIDLGGDIRVIGPRPDGSPWIIGIRHPRSPESSIENIPLVSGAIATSGDYERYFCVDGMRYSHIFNPKTGWPAHGLTSVSICADQCLLAGTLATIAILKEAEGKAWLRTLNVPHHWVDTEMRAKYVTPVT